MQLENENIILFVRLFQTCFDMILLEMIV